MSLSVVRRVALALTLGIVPALLSAQATTGTVRGRVTDAASARGLPDAQVSVDGTRLGAVTGANGEFTITQVPTGPHGMERRMVIYAGGYAEPTTIPPGWYGWMHYRTNEVPQDGDYTPREWEKAHVQNYIGSALAYRPDGSLLNKGERPRVTGDYDAWSPDA